MNYLNTNLFNALNTKMIQLILFVPLAILFVLNSCDCDCDCECDNPTVSPVEPIVIEPFVNPVEPIVIEPFVNPRFFMFEQNITNVVPENKSIKIKIKNNEFTFVYS